MLNNQRLVCLAACAGLAAVAVASPDGGQPIMKPQKLAAAVGQTDDSAELHLASKLGLNTPANPGDLRGLPTCPTILTDTANCHIANLTLGANFSGAAAGAFRTMDNVTVVGQNPDRICWIGRYANRVDPAVADESFQIRIFNDSGGLPDLAGGPIYTSTFLQSGTAGTNLLELSCLDGETCPGTTNPAAGGHWVFSAQVNGGFPMNAGGCYWIEIANVGSNAAGVNWGWVGSQLGTDLTSMQAIDANYNVFTRVANDRALCVSGGVDPLSGGCVIAPLPPICSNPSTNGYLYDETTGFGYRSSSPGSVGRPAGQPGAWTPFQMADGFQFSAAGTVTNVCFSGFWLQVTAAGGAAAVTPPANPNFDVAYFAHGDGVPGAPIPMAEFRANVTPGVSYVWDGSETVSFTHPPVNFAADSCHWISVSLLHPNGDPGTPLWHWFLTTVAGGLDDRSIGYRVSQGTPGGWGVLTDPADPDLNLNHAFDHGPIELADCEPPPPPPPPANDLCADAILLGTPCVGQNVSVNGTTRGATNDGMPACGGATGQTAGGVWYRFAGATGSTTISMCSSAVLWDAQMSVFSGSCANLACVTGDDDFCGGASVSQVTFASAAGTDYYVLIHGFSTANNDFSLVLSSDATCGTPTDCNQNGTPDGQEIAGNPALDCWNGTSPAGMTGGPDGALDVCQCPGNFSRDMAVNSSDISSYLTAWLASVQAPNTNADINCSGSTNSSDISSFLTIWLANINGSSPFDGCP